MSRIRDAVLGANRKYATNFESRPIAPPERRFSVLTCMDPRLDPVKFCGLAEGEAYVIRNAGGRASDDAIRSLVISYKLLGALEWFVIQHTNCAMTTFTNEIMRDLLSKSLLTGPGSRAGELIDWLPIGDQTGSLIDDVDRIKSHPLVPAEIPVYGYLYDVETGLLNEVPEASQRGAPSART